MDGVEEVLRTPPTFVFSVSRDGREDGGAGETARDDAMDGRGEDIVDIV